MSIITWIGNRIKNPEDLDANPWSPSPLAKTSTFATLYIGHETEPKPDRVVLMGFTGKITEPSMSWKCPCCKDIIKYKKGNICKCGRSKVIKKKGGLWVQFRVENSCLVPDLSIGGAGK